mgnify:CR=1 FL=1
MSRRPVIASIVLATLLVVTAACSSNDDKDASPSSTAPSTTSSAATRPAYTERGPNPVGSRTLALADGRRLVIWYPAAKSAANAPTEVFDIASLLAPAMQAKIPAELRPQYKIDAHVGADPATGGPYPVVLFSHGFAGFPEQSVDLTTHLASWGFVVVAPDHVERSLSGLLGTAAQGVPQRDDTAVLTESLDVALADAGKADSPLHDLLDADEVAVTGHSAGAYAAYADATSDKRIKAFISYSVGLDGDRARTKTPPPVPDVPGMIMLGTADGIIPPASSRAVFKAMHAPKYLVEIKGAGHLVFSDICNIGKEQGGLVALTKQAGLDLPPSLLKLASDGCEKGDLDPTKAYDAINHFSVAFLRRYLGVDSSSVGLAPGTAKAFTTADVTLVADPGN